MDIFQRTRYNEYELVQIIILKIGVEVTHMAQLAENKLPLDSNLEDSDISNLSDYLGRISRYIQLRGDEQHFYVYRGEPQKYPIPCRPGLFRKGVLADNPFFEKNLFDTMRQNKLSESSNYLDNAIDAQHGEFPSRLLDVSYNCLTALYFAVTPYYHLDEDAYDDKDGWVFIFFLDEIFSPSAQNTNQNYEAIIERKEKWLQEPLLGKNFKFIDHTKLNNRIVAQQGAFLLFQGDLAEELPQSMYYGIRIPGKAKPTLRRELKQMFGIHTGSIYPETVNLVQELTHKSSQLNTQPFTLKNELHYTLKQLSRELDYYFGYLYRLREQGNPSALLRGMRHVEQVVDSYRTGLLHLVQNRELWKTELSEDAENSAQAAREEIDQFKKNYNQQISEFHKKTTQYGLGDFQEDALKLKFDLSE